MSLSVQYVCPRLRRPEHDSYRFLTLQVKPAWLVLYLLKEHKIYGLSAAIKYAIDHINISELFIETVNIETSKFT